MTDFHQYRNRFTRQKLTHHKKTWLALMALGIGIGWYRHKQKLAKITLASAVALSACAYAQISEQQINDFAHALQSASNQQNPAHVARLLADDALISLNRPSKSGITLDKDSYVDFWQKNWANSHYRCTITPSHIIITEDGAKAQLIIKESWQKDGTAQTLNTQSRVTFGMVGGQVVLLRAISQLNMQ